MDELVEINLNYEGEDYQIFDSINTANILLNDPDALKSYMENYLYSEVEKENCSLPETETSETHSTTSIIWSGRRSSITDDHATKILLESRMKLDSKFNDKKTPKTRLWKEISVTLSNQGFNLGENPIEKVRQKFYNLQKLYLAHLKHLKTTGVGRRDPPPFFDELNEILGGKDKSNPKNLIDSEEKESEKENEIEKEGVSEESTPSTSGIRNRFHGERKRMTPLTQGDKIIKTLREEIALDRAERFEQLNHLKEQFAIFNASLADQNKQRDQFLNIFAKLVEKKNRKRKRDYSSESD